MKKIIGFIVLICLIIGCIIGFYSLTGFYVWSDSAVNSKLVRKSNSFSIHNSGSSVYADGEIVNATKNKIVINPNEIIIYCQDKNTNEIFCYANLLSYTIKKNSETTIAINILKPPSYVTTESGQHASYIAENYQIIKIEYKLSDSEIYEIKSVEQTNSYFLPLGTIIAVPIVVCLSIVLFILLKKKNSRISKIRKSIENQRTQLNIQLNEIKSKISKNNYTILNLRYDVDNFENKIIAQRGGINYVDSLNGWEFEEYCVKLFTQLNYLVEKTKGSGDCGADLILDNSISVQCKLYSGAVGIHALYEVYGSMAKYKTKYAWVVTNSHFTKQAIDYSQEANIKLIDRKQLIALIKKAYVPVSNRNVVELKEKMTSLQNENNDLSSKATDIERQIEKLTTDLNALDNIKVKDLQSLEKIYNI